MSFFIRRSIQNVAILLLLLTGIKNLLAALPIKFAEPFNHFYDNVFVPNTKIADPNIFTIHHISSFFIGVLMVLLVYRLYKRITLAWYIEICVLVISVVTSIIRHQSISSRFIVIEIFVLIVLLFSYKDFCRRVDGITVKKAFMFIGASLFLVLTNATIGLFIIRQDIHGIHDIIDAISSSVQLLFFMNTEVLAISGRTGTIYAGALIGINWACIISSFALLLKPLIYTPISTLHDKDKARHLALEFGQNPISYLALENDKKYLFSHKINGVCAYRLVGNVFVVCGDMICDKKDGFVFLSEILTFCNQNGYEILFMNVTEYFLELYKIAGFGVLKYGEDACFKLDEYNLKGGQVAKVRAAINHANNAGIKVYEYVPTVHRNIKIEKEMEEITSEWLHNKNGEELRFMLGGNGLMSPLDRRYFYALDTDGRMLGYVVFLPYLSKKGYMADVTRRRKNAPQGVLEKVIFEAYMIMKDEGVIWGNMGLSPLYNVAMSDKAAFTEKVFSYIFDNMNKNYDFKALHHAKKKYAPTEWQSRYLAFSPKTFSINFGYAIIRVQSNSKINETILSSLFGKKK